MKKQQVLLLVVVGLVAVMLAGCVPSLHTAYDAGQAYQSEGKYEDAIRMYHQFVGNFQGDFLAPYALYNVGLCYVEMGRQTEAVEALKRVKARYPASEPAVWAASMVRRLQGAPSER